MKQPIQVALLPTVDNVLANAEIVYRKVYGACGKDTDVSNVLPSYISFWEQMNSITPAKEKMYTLEQMYLSAANVVDQMAANRGNSEWHMKATPKMVVDNWLKMKT